MEKTKAIKVPADMTCSPHFNRDLKLNGLSIVESCTQTSRKQGTMFLQNHMLLVVMEGTNKITYCNNEFVVNKNEMVFLKKAIQIGYDKTGNPEKGNVYESMMFFLKDEFLIEFMKMANIQSVETDEMVKVVVKPVKPLLQKFFDSVVPYFENPEAIDGNLLKLKMMELLYDLASTDKNLLQQLLQLKQQVYGDIPTIVMEHYATPATLTELAYLSGRSLSSFKRDFHAIYKTTPALWIREKRLTKAAELLRADMAVKDVCYSLGFESVAHFSRLYKSHYGCSPSAHKTELQSA
ncbi:AraC family transcriptional regulator [Mucilaginibacter gynuensis]